MRIWTLIFTIISCCVISSCGGGTEETQPPVKIENRKPIANAGDSQTVLQGNSVTINGFGSDPDGDNLTYRWSVISSPEGSLFKLNNQTASTTVFSADLAGKYVIQLIVNDGKLDSEPHLTSVVIQEVQGNILTAMVHHIALTAGLKYTVSNRPNEFKRTTFRGTLECKENTTINFYIGSTLLGEHPCLKNIYLSHIKNNGVKISDRQITNLSWLLQIMDTDQELTEHNSTAIGISIRDEFADNKNFLIDIETSEFVDANNLRNFVKNNLTKYQSLEDRFFDWESKTDDQKSEIIIGNATEAMHYHNSYFKNMLRTDHASNTDLQNGFPLLVEGLAPSGSCSHKSGAHNSVLVGNLDQEPNQEIIVNRYPCGSIYIVDANGKLVSKKDKHGIENMALFRKNESDTYYSIVSQMGTYDWTLSLVTSLPVEHGHFGLYSPSIAYDKTNRADNIFFPTYYSEILRYDSNSLPVGSYRCNQIKNDYCSQEMVTPSVGDFDNDGEIEVVTASKYVMEGIFVFEHDGKIKNGFPVSGYTIQGSNPVVGDVDKDGSYEIIYISSYQQGIVVNVIDFNGKTKYQITPNKTMMSWGNDSVVLSDLNGDSYPEIIVSSMDYINIFEYNKGSFRLMDGWPQRLNLMNGFSDNNNYPVIGDVNGDNLPDIVILYSHLSIASDLFPGAIAKLLAYNIKGELLSGFPKNIDSFADVNATLLSPAISDIDNDGRNEIVISGTLKDRRTAIYVYDLGGEKHGPVLWGQYGKDAQHSGFIPKQ